MIAGGRRRAGFGACLALSLGLHLLWLGLADHLLSRQPTALHVRLEPAPQPVASPYRPRPGFGDRGERFAARWTPRPPRPRGRASSVGDGHWLLEQGTIAGDSSLLAGLDSLRVSEPGPPDIGDESEVLQAWRDSLEGLLAIRDRVAEVPLTPFEAAIRAQLLGETVVLVDPETGRLARASWRLPVYGREACPGQVCIDYNGRFRAFEDDLRSTLEGRDLPPAAADPWPGLAERKPQPLPLRATLDDGYSFNYQPSAQRARVPPDPVHTYGWQPFRDALAGEELQRYPVVLLQWIDPASSQALGRYLGDGGFAVVTARQLDRLAAALAEQLDRKRVRQVGIWSGHPLMRAWFQIDDYYPAPRSADEAPVVGLEVDGRLAAVALRSRRTDLFVNAVVYGLAQPTDLGGRYPSR